jgi:hypothetical protein
MLSDYSEGCLDSWKEELEFLESISNINYCVMCQRKNKSIKDRIKKLKWAINLKELEIENGKN